MKHLDESELSALQDRALEDRPLAEAERHLAECAKCREALGVLEAQDRSLAQSLTHDPGDAYFESFAARVQSRIRSEGVAMDTGSETPEVSGPSTRRIIPAPAESLLERLGRWFTGPRLAWAGAAVAMIVGAGVVFLVDDGQPVRTIEDRTLAARAKQVAEPAPPPAATMAEPEAKAGDAAVPRATTLATPEAKARDAARTPAVGSREREGSDSRAFAPPPAAGTDARKSAAADEELSVTADKDAASAAPATPAPSAAKREAETLPGRSRQVRREQGEDVPVQAQGESRASVPPAAPTTGTRADANVSKTQRIKEQARAIAGGALEANRKPGEVSSFAAPGSTAIGFDSPGAVRVCGTVRDANGRPIAGARVAIADVGTSTTTDAAGSWCLAALPGEHTVTVMAVGFREVRRAFGVTAGGGNQDFTLAPVPVLGNASGEADAAASVWPPAARSLAAAAERASRDAAVRNTAGAHDSAATRWQKVTESVKVGPAAITARRHLADARYRAWRIDPTPVREAEAMSALSSYLAAGPGGSERERAQRRLEELRRR